VSRSQTSLLQDRCNGICTSRKTVQMEIQYVTKSSHWIYNNFKTPVNNWKNTAKTQLCAKFEVIVIIIIIIIQKFITRAKSHTKLLQKYYRETATFRQAPLAQGHPNFSSWCDFMTGLSKPKLCTKFEVTSFSRCRNIKGEAPNFGERP